MRALIAYVLNEGALVGFAFAGVALDDEEGPHRGKPMAWSLCQLWQTYALTSLPHLQLCTGQDLYLHACMHVCLRTCMPSTLSHVARRGSASRDCLAPLLYLLSALTDGVVLPQAGSGSPVGAICIGLDLSLWLCIGLDLSIWLCIGLDT